MPTPNTAVSLLLVGVTSMLANEPTQQSWLMNHGWLVVLVVVGMIAIALTSYRYLLGYFALGMLYWLAVEGLHWLVVSVAPDMSETNSYVTAIALSLVPILSLLVWQPKRLSIAQSTKPSVTNVQPMPRFGAGQRPFILEKDSDFNQQFIRHSSITDK